MRKSRKVKGGKRSLCSPARGSSNYRKAQEGRFADHPAFIACKSVAGVQVALHHLMETRKKIKIRLPAIVDQLEKALRCLSEEANKLSGKSEKLRFAEAIANFFSPWRGSDHNVWRVCWREIEMRTTQHEKPSQAESRRAVESEDGTKFSDEQWKRLMKRTGLNKKLPTHRQKRAAGRVT
jgi:hypothetical protein